MASGAAKDFSPGTGRVPQSVDCVKVAGGGEGQAATREILLLEQQADRQLYGKPGWTTQPDPDIAWFVGWVVNEEKVYPFALNMDLLNSAQRNLRITLAKGSLKILGLYP